MNLAQSSEPLAVLRVFPEDKAFGITTDAKIYVYFNNPMDVSTINGSNLRVVAAGAAVTGEVTYDAAKKRAAFIPQHDLAYSTDYSVSLEAAVKDTSGQQLGASMSWSFKTIDQVYSAAGVLDTSFADDGLAVFSGGQMFYETKGYSCILDPAGNIYTVGQNNHAAGGNSDMVIWKYKPDGSLDSAFGSGGTALNSGTNGAACGVFGLIDPAGKILVIGVNTNKSSSDSNLWNEDAAVWRYNPDGTLDTSFGSSGMATFGDVIEANASDGANAAIIDPISGSITVLGSSNKTTSGVFESSNMVLWRLSSDGKLDESFGNKGVSLIEGAAGFSMIKDPKSNDILVVGTSFVASGPTKMTVWRFDQNGVLLNSFSGAGDEEGRDIKFDPAGKILVAGTFDDDTNKLHKVFVRRFDPDGSIDNTFGSSGTVILGEAAGKGCQDYVNSLVLDPAGKILVTGSSLSLNNINHLFIQRLDSNGTPDTAFGANGKILNQGEAGTGQGAYGNAITVDTWGRIIAAGNSTYPGLAAFEQQKMTVWRYR